MRILRWILLTMVSLLGLVVVTVALLLLLSDLPAVRAAVRPRLESLLESVLSLQVEVGEVTKLGLFRGVGLDGVVLSRDGERLLAAGSLRLDLEVGSLVPPHVAIDATATGLEAEMRRGPDGEWNLVDAFAGEEEPAAEPSPPPAWLGAITVHLVDARLTVEDVAEKPLVLSDVDGTAVVRLGMPGRLTALELTTQLGDESRLAARGWLDLGEPSRVELALEAKPVAGADLQAFAPQVAADARIAGTVKVDGSLDAPRAEVHLAAGDAAVDLWAAVAEVDAGTRIDASWQVGDLDPAALVADAPAASISGEGSVLAVLDGAWPSELEASARFWSSAVAGVGAEWLTLQAHREGERIAAALQVAAPNDAASAELEAWVGVDEPHPASAELRFALTKPAELPAPVPSTLPDSQLRGTLTANASSVTASDRTIAARLELEPGRLRGVELDSALARVALAGDVLSLEEVRVEGGATKLAATGWVEMAGEPDARDLRLEVSGPVDLGLVPEAQGTVRVLATAWGTMAAIDARVRVASDGAVVLPGAAGTFQLTATADDVGSPDVKAEAVLDAKLEPDARLEETLGSEPIDVDLEVDWTQVPPARASLVADAAQAGAGPVDRVGIELAAVEQDGRRHTLVAAVERSGETVGARLEELRITPATGPPWSLLQTASVLYSPDRIVADDLAFGSRAGRVSLDGALVRDGRNDLTLGIADVDIGELCTIAGLEQECAGDLAATLRFAGTTARPDISGTVRASGLTLAGQDYGGADLALETEERLVVRGSLGKAPLGPLELTARVPLQGGWPAPTVPPTGNLDATVTGDDIRLEGFATFAGEAITELAGRADLNVTVAGTLAEPRLSGGLTAADVRLGLTATGATWRDGRLAMSFAGDEVRVEELSFADGDQGTLAGSGRVELGEGDTDVDVEVRLASFTVLARPDVAADASGAIRIGGSLGAPEIEGQVRIDSATIRPALLPGAGGPEKDDTITIVNQDPAAAEEPPETIGERLVAVEGGEGEAEARPREPDATVFDRTTMNVTVTLGDPVVVQRIDAYIRLNGEIYITKAANDPLRVSGQIYSDRGWYMFRGRRIVLREAAITFSGETPINPYINVSATYQAPEYLVTVRVEGTAAKPELELSSQPPLDQSDVLAVLLFGKPTSQLTSGQGTELQQQAIGLLASYVAPELEQSIMDTFGLASLTFQLPTGTSYGSVGVGRYFGDDIFVSVGQTFGGPQGGTSRQLQGLVGSSLTVQYYLTPNITLQTSSSTDGESALDAIWHMRY